MIFILAFVRSHDTMHVSPTLWWSSGDLLGLYVITVMDYYILNNTTQYDTGVNEVHIEALCSHLPEQHNRIPLGFFADCSRAIKYAQNSYPHVTVDGCRHCVPACHTR